MILVTGASGFLGGAIARALVGRGTPVRALVRPSSQVEQLEALGIPRVSGDVLEPSTLTGAMQGCETIIHCAGVLGRAGARDEEFTRIHAGGLLNVLRAAREAGIKRVVYLSSPGILGPVRGAPADESAPLNPTNPYERAKAAAEQAVHTFEAQHGPLVVMVRPEFVYGPGDLHVLRLFQAIQKHTFFFIGSGQALCHPTYVDDAVEGVLAALDRGALGRTYHLAGPRPVTIQELAETFAEAMGVWPPVLHVPELAVRAGIASLRPLAHRFGRELPIDSSGVDFFTLDRQFSTLRAKVELGVSARVDLAAGVRQTVDWYRARRLLT